MKRINIVEKIKNVFKKKEKHNEHGQASRRAVIEYANIIRKTNKTLAEGLDSWILNINIKRVGRKNLRSIVPD